MGLYKVTWFFEGLQNAILGAGAAVGWTETWALNQASNNIDDVFTNPDVITYTNKRQNCLSVQYRMSFLRATNIPTPGDLGIRRVKVASLLNRGGAASVFGQGGSQVQCCILVDLQKLPVVAAEGVHHRKFLCRGLPPDVINGNVLNTAAPNWNRFTDFFNFIGNRPTEQPGNNPNRATMLGVSYQDPAMPAVACPQITVDANDLRLIKLKDVTAYVPGEQVRIRGWTGLNGVMFNRAWNFISSEVVGPDTFKTFGKSRFDLTAGVYPFPNAAKLQRTRFLVGPFDQYAIIGLRSKRTGRVFHQLRGRSGRKVSQ